MKNISTHLWRLLASSALALLSGCTAPAAQTSTPAAPPLPITQSAKGHTSARPTFQKTALDAAPAQLKDDDNALLGNPSNAATGSPDNLLVTRPQFTLSYNRTNGGPNWVSWHVQTSDLGRVGRGQFLPDPLLPADSQIRPNDYRGSGYDRGHQCPSGDRTSLRDNNNATFVMSNMLPQAAALNRQVWAKLESYCRDQVRAGNELYIVAGGSGTQGRINNKINIPQACWKIVVVLPQGDNDLQRITPETRVIAVSMPNQDTPEVGGARWATFLTTPASIEQATGFHFFLNLSPTTRQALEQKRDSGRGSNASTGGQSTRPRSRRTRRAPSQFVPVPEPGASLDGPATDGLSPDVPTTSEVPQPAPQEAAPSVNPRGPNTQAVPGAGVQVWVNLNSGVYHYSGTRWYGNTKEGQYMSEDAAKAAGYRAAENGQ